MTIWVQISHNKLQNQPTQIFNWLRYKLTAGEFFQGYLGIWLDIFYIGGSKILSILLAIS